MTKRMLFCWAANYFIRFDTVFHCCPINF